MTAAAVSIGIFFWLIGLAVSAALYFLPTIIALMLHRSNAGIVALINFLLGWSFVGWIVALVMALTSDSRPMQVVQVQQYGYPPPQGPPQWPPQQSAPPPGHDLMNRPGDPPAH